MERKAHRVERPSRHTVNLRYCQKQKRQRDAGDAKSCTELPTQYSIPGVLFFQERNEGLMAGNGEDALRLRARWWRAKAWPVLVHSMRTGVAAVTSVLVARLFRLPEAYWAPITTLVIAQSSLGAALTVSWQRIVGTATGAVLGAIVANYFGMSLLVFGVSVFLLGVLFAATQTDRAAYRFGGITLAIVLLIPRTEPASRIAFHRFAEVSIGIGVALVFAVVWPEIEPAGAGK
jgi:uncharacterized membrane protein YccC